MFCSLGGAVQRRSVRMGASQSCSPAGVWAEDTLRFFLCLLVFSTQFIWGVFEPHNVVTWSSGQSCRAGRRTAGGSVRGKENVMGKKMKGMEFVEVQRSTEKGEEWPPADV